MNCGLLYRISRRNQAEKEAKLAYIKTLIEDDNEDALIKLIGHPHFEPLYPNEFLATNYTPLGEAIRRKKQKALRAVLAHPELDGNLIANSREVAQDMTPFTLLIITNIDDDEGKETVELMYDMLVKSPKTDINQIAYGNSVTNVMIACAIPSFYYLHKLLKTPGIQINQLDEEGSNALHRTIEFNRRKHLNLLLHDPRIAVDRRGKQIVSGGTDAQTALATAVIKGRVDLVRMFLAAGARVEVQVYHIFATSKKQLFDLYNINLLQVIECQVEETFEKRRLIARLLNKAAKKPIEISSKVLELRKEYKKYSWITQRCKDLTAELVDVTPRRILTLRQLGRRALLEAMRTKSGSKTILPLGKRMVEKCILPVTLNKYVKFDSIHLGPLDTSHWEYPIVLEPEDHSGESEDDEE